MMHKTILRALSSRSEKTSSLEQHIHDRLGQLDANGSNSEELGTELPAGKYDFTLNSMAMPAKILLHGPNGYMWVLTSAVSGKEQGETNNLTIERRNGERYISALYLADLGIDLRYRAPKLNEKVIAQAPATIEHISIANGK